MVTRTADASDAEPSRKRHRAALSAPSNSNGRVSTPDAERARAQVAEVFKLWESLHGTLDGQKLGSQDALQQMKALRRDSAGSLALAACWKGFTDKIHVDPVTALALLTDVLAVIASTAQAELAAAALSAVVSHLAPLMASSAVRTGPDDSIKDPLKTFTVAVLTLCQRGRPHEAVLLETARQAFCRRPYWFMMALTDALEQQSHPALDGAIHFSRIALLEPPTEACLFLRVMRQDPVAANQVSMLLRSCIGEMRGTPSLAASVQLMTHLEALLADPNAKHASTALPGPPPAATVAPEPQARSGADAATLASEQAPPAVKAPRATASPPPTSKRQRRASEDPSSDERRSRSPPQRGVDGASPAPAAPAVLPEGKLSDDYDGDAAAAGVVACCVGPVLRLAALPRGAEAMDIAGALRPWGATGIEALPERECLAQFESVAAAACAFQALPEWLGAAGFGRVRVSFASSSDGEATCLFVRGVASTAQCHGVLKTLEADRVPVPDGYALVQNAFCAASCIFQWDNPHDAEDARHTVRAWVDDVAPLFQEAQRRQRQEAKQQQQQRHEMEQARQQPPQREPRRSPSVGAQRSSRRDAEGGREPSGQLPATKEAGGGAGAGAAKFWAGELLKSGVQQTSVRICSANAACREQSKEWPPALDMRHRTTLDCVAAMWKGAGATQGWCWLAPTHAGDDGFAAFVAYLEQRQRAGIVRADGLDGSQKTLYLVPATAALSEQLAIPHVAGCLLALAPVEGGDA